ncbi:spindle pole body component 110-like [Solea senegalensis]|uniref:Spindle pole body component 110-like n=2 Tax=Solea senegalensis TaxID=28829 RepID=A0AAV6S6K0_SOLSE|nr:spindle pole body component 110-like [Solea senegalensis]
MEGACAEERQRRPRRWKKSPARLSRGLFCCSCWPCEERDSLQEQEMKINGDPQYPRLDHKGSREKEAIQITVEDLGIVNTSFNLLDEDPLTPENNMGHLASSVSACARALKKKGLKPLSSLPIEPQTRGDITSASIDGDAEKKEDPLLYESGTDSAPMPGSLLTPPVITLIPPTPSDVAEDDQFFDINSVDSVAHTSGSDGSFAVSDQECYEDKIEGAVAEESDEGLTGTERGDGDDNAAEPEEVLSDGFAEEREAVPTKEKTKARFLRSAYQVAPLPECPQRRRFNTGINLLSFTEHNLDDLGNKDGTCAERLKAELCLPLHAANMDTLTHQRRRITRSCSLGDALTRSTTFHALTHTIEQHLEEEGSPQKRRITIASYVTQSKDQNGNFAEKDVDRQVAKCLRELNTDELCQWFTNIGLQKCLPFIKEAKLCGVDMASVDVNTLDILQVATLEDREQLLSAIYNELHPPSAMVLRLDSLLESSRPPNVETFTATLASMSKSKSAPHVSRLPMNRRSLKLSQNYMAQRNSQLIEVTINASERIVHLRTPRETTAGKIKDSCMKMLGITEDKSLFTLKEKQGSAEELPADQQIGSLLTKTSDKRQLELYLCKMEKPTPTASQNSPEVKRTNENVNISIKVEGSQSAKQERIRELNQQVDSLQNVIFQVQELHHSLVAFCTELKNMDGDLNIDRLGSDELKQRLESVQSQLNDKRQSLQNLRDNMDNLAALKNKQLEVGLLEKMKLNCQVFKEDISMVHLNRQAAHLQKALQESKDKAQKMSQAIGSLSQLVSPQSPAMLLVVQENQGPDGHYGFACCYTEGNGLVVDKVDNTHLCVDDRLVEVNSVPVVNYTQEELTDLLLQGPTAQIVVLRQPPPALACLQHLVNPDPMKSTCLQSDVVTMETPPRRKVMAI